MPWKPRYSEAEARAAIESAETWKQVLEALDYPYYGKNIQTVRKWAARWGIDVSHLPSGRSGLHHRYTPSEARAAIGASRSWAEALRRLGYCHTGANPKTLQKRAREWGISTAHFDGGASARVPRRKPKPLSEILIERSTYSRSSLKQRLFGAGLKERRCELCGQGELWHGKRIGLILDHANGVRDDNRLENLRIICPNCAAGLDYALWPQEPGDPRARRMSSLRDVIPTPVKRSAVLLPLLRQPLGSHRRQATRSPEGRAASTSAALARGRRTWIPWCRPAVRRER